MKPPTLLLLPLWPLLWLKRQLSREVTLRVEGRRLRLAWVDRDALPAAPPRAAAPAVVAPDTVVGDTSQMPAELQRLLGRHEQARQLMRHLGYVERTLRLAGADALETLPLELLQKAQDQLEQLVADWSNPGLAELHLRLAMTIGDKQEASRRYVPANSALSDFGAPGKMEVSEASTTQFRELQRDADGASSR